MSRKKRSLYFYIHPNNCIFILGFKICKCVSADCLCVNILKLCFVLILRSSGL
jgi:hypothetical protein